MKVSNFAVTSYRFEAGMCLPRRVELDGISYYFTDRGLKLQVGTKGLGCTLVAFTDGVRTFHLKTDRKSGSWQLVKVV
jgi:hypothetical protein